MSTFIPIVLLPVSESVLHKLNNQISQFLEQLSLKYFVIHLCDPILGNEIPNKTLHFSRATHLREQFGLLQPQSTSVRHPAAAVPALPKAALFLDNSFQL